MLPVFGLFHKRIEGDDTLLTLAQKQFARTGMAPEYYCESAKELRHLLGFLPREGAPAIVHLPRHIDLLSREDRNRIGALAEEFGGVIHGFVVHDQQELKDETDRYEKAVRRLDSTLDALPEAPFLFIEYARMLPFKDFYRFFERIRDTKKTGTCLDIGHLGISRVGPEFARRRPGGDIFSFKNREKISAQTIRDINTTVEKVLPQVNEQIKRFGSLGNPLHFHLHDAHPLWNKSPFGVSDHLSFFQEIFIRNEENRAEKMPLIYGPDGLKKIVEIVRRTDSLDRVSFSLEIHPAEDRAPLNGFEELFSHWRDKTNAEKMNFWLQTLQKNQQLLIEFIKNGEHYEQAGQ